MSKNDGQSQVNFYIYRKYMPEVISTPNLVALPITSQELVSGGGGIFAKADQKRNLQKTDLNHDQTLFPLSQIFLVD